MKYLLPCKCGQSVEIEPSQAGQTVACGCGEGLLIPSMLQIRALPIALEKPEPSRKKKRSVPYLAALITLSAGIVCAIMWGGCEWLRASSEETFWLAGFGFLPILYILVRGLTYAFGGTFIALAVRDLVKSPLAEDTTIRRTFFVLGIVLLFSACISASYWREWQPQPRYATLKRTMFVFGDKMLPQDTTPIPWAERRILWMSEEEIDRMEPTDLFRYFRTLENLTFSYNFQVNYEAVKDTYRIWVTTTIILFILAFSSIVVSFFMPRQEVVVTGWSGSDWH